MNSGSQNKERERRERGSALIISLFVSLVVTGLCTTMILISNANALVAANERDRERALFASKAGLNYGYHLYVTQQITASAEGTVFDSFDPSVSSPLDGASFVARIFDDGGSYRVLSTGNYRRASRTTELVFELEPDLYQYGFVGFNEVNLHIHSPSIHDAFELQTTIYSNNWVEVHNPISIEGSVVASGTVDLEHDTERSTTRTAIDGDIFAYALENNGLIDGNVKFVASVEATGGTPDVVDSQGNPYVWYLDRSNPDHFASGSGSVSGSVGRHVVQDGDTFEFSIFNEDGSIDASPDLNVVQYLEPPKLDYRAMKAEADENDPTFFATMYQAVRYLAQHKVTETVGGQTVTTVKIGTPDRPEFIYVQEELTLTFDPDSPSDYYGAGIVKADGLHIEGGIYSAGDFTFDGKVYVEPDGLPDGYDMLRINATPYCMPAIVAYSEPPNGSIDSWTEADTPPMMQENQSIIQVRSHHPMPGLVRYQGPVTINGLTYAEYESHYHHMASDRELITFSGAQLAYKIHNCDYFDFTFDPGVACTQFVSQSEGAGTPTVVSFRELR